MCASMADIQSTTAETRQGKKRKTKPQGKNIIAAFAMQGCHNNQLPMHQKHKTPN